jgi:protein-S-isoprenylcysteine O-methyltransferase Ste14
MARVALLYAPLVGIVISAVIGVGWRSWLHRRRYGSSGIVLFRGGSAGDRLRDVIPLLLSAVLAGEAVAWAIWPESLPPLIVAPPPTFLGAVVMALGIAITVRAQLDLGASWRVGIDPNATPGLVANGLYAHSRNPIFAGVLVSVLGLAILMPTWISIVALIGSILAIRNQVLDEEAYLIRSYGGAYESYARRVGRFVPWVGRLT